MKKQLYAALSSILPTYQHAAPEDSTELPVCIYSITLENYAQVWDDKQVGKQVYFKLKIYNSSDDTDLVDQIEETVKSTFAFCYLRNKQETKEDGLFLTVLDFIKQ